MASLNAQNIIRNIEKSYLKKELPRLQIGDNVKIGVKIIEGNKERIQFYEGTILAQKNSSINTTITVRKTLQGIGIERIFLIHYLTAVLPTLSLLTNQQWQINYRF